jgi:hypothetical protein
VVVRIGANPQGGAPRGAMLRLAPALPEKKLDQVDKYLQDISFWQIVNKLSSLFCPFVSNEEKIWLGTTLHFLRNLRMGPIS